VKVVQWGDRWQGDRDWFDTVGVVYLVQCGRTGEYKVGGSIDPASRLRQLYTQARTKLGRELGYVWSIITNGVGRLESYWLESWDSYRVTGTRREWFLLPDTEVARFRSLAVVNFRDYPPVPSRLKDVLGPPDPKTALGCPPGVRWVRPNQKAK
jgi:hypothetical protein